MPSKTFFYNKDLKLIESFLKSLKVSYSQREGRVVSDLSKRVKRL